tara:strand:+ start:179 stop:964 length:786 start_codon:yes stop_codon:yes gene_type:complete
MKLKNVDTSLEKLDKCVLNSLSFLDNKNVYVSIVFVLFLFNTCLFTNINNYVSEVYQNSIVKVLMLLLIIYVSRKSYVIGLLLALSYVISLNYKTIMENFVSGYDSGDKLLHELKDNTQTNSEPNESFMNHLPSENESFMNHPPSENESFMNHPPSENETFMGDLPSENETFMGDLSSENESFMNHPSSENETFMSDLSSENESFMNESIKEKKNCSTIKDATKHQEVNDLCKPVNTFNNSLNAQGINNITGYEKVVGSSI